MKENCTQMIIIVFFFFIICFFLNFSVWRNYQKRVGLMRHWYLLYLYGDTRCTESSEIVWVELLTWFGLTQQFKRLLNRWIFTWQCIRGKNTKLSIQFSYTERFSYSCCKIWGIIWWKLWTKMRKYLLANQKEGDEKCLLITYLWNP